MARPRKNGSRNALFRELKSAMDEVDSLKNDLRNAKTRVGALVRKLNLSVASHQNPSRKRRAKRADA
jgi:hypothetical protein